jgi:hypothetical protein
MATKSQQKYTNQEEQALMAQLWSPMIKDSPLTFVLFAFPWGEPGTPLEHHKGPRRWQIKVLRKIEKHIKEGKELNLPALLRLARGSGRGIGKSALVAWLSLWFVTTRLGGTVIISANTEDQLRAITFAELGKWQAMSINEHWWDLSGIQLNPAGWLSELVTKQMQKGTKYWGVDGKLWSAEKPDAYAGPHNHDGMMVIFDEASGIPDAIWTVAGGFFTEPTFNRFWFAFSQGRRNSGTFFEIFNKKRDFWESEQIDSRTVEGTDPKIYQDIIDEYGEDSDEARVEVYGMFPDDDDIAFIGNKLIMGAINRVIVEDKTAPITMGIDPSRGGKDKFSIVVRQGRKILSTKRFSLADSEIGTMEGVGHIIDTLEEFDPDMSAIDEGGLGGPIYDRLKELGYGKRIKGVNFAWSPQNKKRWGNKRAEMWGEMKMWLATGCIPDDKILRTDLAGPRKKPDSKGVMFLESKKDMRARGLASPDVADALALTFAFKPAKRAYNKQAGKHGTDSGYRYVPAVTSWMGN